MDSDCDVQKVNPLERAAAISACARRLAKSLEAGLNTGSSLLPLLNNMVCFLGEHQRLLVESIDRALGIQNTSKIINKTSKAMQKLQGHASLLTTAISYVNEQTAATVLKLNQEGLLNLSSEQYRLANFFSSKPSEAVNQARNSEMSKNKFRRENCANIVAPSANLSDGIDQLYELLRCGVDEAISALISSNDTVEELKILNFELREKLESQEKKHLEHIENQNVLWEREKNLYLADKDETVQSYEQSILSLRKHYDKELREMAELHRDATNKVLVLSVVDANPKSVNQCNSSTILFSTSTALSQY